MLQMAGLAKRSNTAFELLMTFTRYMGKNNALVCSQTSLADFLGVSRETINRAVKLLKNEKWLMTMRVGGAMAYILNSNYFWTASANGKAYALFSATVMVSAQEQERQDFEYVKTVELKNEWRAQDMQEAV